MSKESAEQCLTQAYEFLQKYCERSTRYPEPSGAWSGEHRLMRLFQEEADLWFGIGEYREAAGTSFRLELFNSRSLAEACGPHLGSYKIVAKDNNFEICGDIICGFTVDTHTHHALRLFLDAIKKTTVL